jgi:predicted transcriptional regulator YdeE
MTNGFKVIGISIQTTNANNQSQQDLGQLWGQLHILGLTFGNETKN